jgi:EmrB/QacA subfamily drug resistance transporter
LTSSIATTTPPGIRGRWLALAVLCAGQLMIILDQTIVNVALPSIQRDLGFSQAGLAWVVNVYLIAFAGLLLLSGRLGDLIGRRRMFAGGLIVFTIASLLCGLAESQWQLIAARFLQGGGGAMASAVVLGMIVAMFRDARQLATAIAFFSFVGAAGGALGPLVGGVLTQSIGWHWVFFVNVPIGLLATPLTMRFLAAERGLGLRHGADAPGAVLVTAGLMLAIYVIVGVPERGWVSAPTLGFGAVAAGLLVAFFLRQARTATPLLSLHILRSRNLAGANLIQMLFVAAMFGFLFLGTLYIQRVLGYDPARTGTALLPIPVLIGMVSLLLSARLNTRYGPRAVLIAGLALIAAGLALLSRAPVDAVYAVDVLPVLLLLGTGGGLALPAMTAIAMADATPEDSGLASGLFNTTQQVGGAVGLAVLATLASARTDTLLAQGRNDLAALTSGYHLAFGIGAALVTVALVLALTMLRVDPRADQHTKPSPKILDQPTSPDLDHISR